MKILNFKLQIKNLLANPLLSGSMVMVVGNNLFNLLQFAYHFIVIRLLTTTDYGDLAAIISILGIIGMIQQAFGLTVVKFVASQRTKESVSNFIKWFNYWGLIAAVAVAFLLFSLSPFLSSFLNLTQPNIVYLFPLMVFFFVIIYIHRAILQGLLSFTTYITSFIAEGLMKIIATVILTSLGMSLFGAMIGILIGVVFGFIVTRVSLSPYLVGNRGVKPEVAPLLKYSLPVFLQGLAFTSMYSMDILLVKHFFSPQESGTYAYLSVLGRIALYASSPITSTMFPLVVKRYTVGQSYRKILYIALLLVTAISSFFVLIFKFAPQVPLILLGKSEGQEILWWFGLFMALLGIAMLLIQFYLSVGKTKPVWIFMLAAVFQSVLIWFIHPTLLAVVQISILSTALLIIALLVYFLLIKDEKAPLSDSTSIQARKNDKERPRKHRSGSKNRA